MSDSLRSAGSPGGLRVWGVAVFGELGIAVLATAFLAGIVSFFAPCVLPLIPAYLAILTGFSYADLTEDVARYRRRILLSSLFYVLGFSLVFVALGLSASALGLLLRENLIAVQRVGGVLIIVFGLVFAGILRLPILSREFSFRLPERLSNLGYATPLLVGVIFGSAWTPCVGPVLGSILILASTTGEAAAGGVMLFAYAMGIALPFMVVSLSLSSSERVLKGIGPRLPTISLIGGLLLVLLGVLLVTGLYQTLTAYLLGLAARLGFTGL